MLSVRKPKYILKFENPASVFGALWRDALPTGNGKTGAAVYGGVCEDTILINSATLWWQGKISVLPDVSDKCKEVRKMLEEGKFPASADVMSNALIAKNYRPLTSFPLPLCDLKVKTNIERPVKEYARAVNMENGEVSVVYKDGATKYDRSCFVSRANDCVVYEINKNGSKSIDVELKLDMHDKNNNKTPQGVSVLPSGAVSKYEGFFMFFSAKSDTGDDFGAVAKITHYGGSIQVKSNSVKITGANSALVLLKIFHGANREKEWAKLKAELAAIKLPYDKLLKEHAQLHGKLINEVEMELTEDDHDLTIEELLAKNKDKRLSLTLLEKLWMYGRYLFICGTEQNGSVMPPYGLWCGDYKAENPLPLANGVLQSIYLNAFSGNLSENILAVFNFYENLIDDFKKNSVRLFGTKGIFIPPSVSLGSGLPGTVNPKDIHFTGCAGMIANLFYSYYLYNNDLKFLKDRALPFMKEAALFYEEFFKLNQSGVYSSGPSYSPYTTPANFYNEEKNEELAVATDAAVDFAVARELFTNLINGSAAANQNKNDIERWREFLNKIPKERINPDNTVAEYNSPLLHDNFSFPGVSHLYLSNNSLEFLQGEEIKKSYFTTLKKKLAASVKNLTSLGLCNFANGFANLQSGENAYDCLDYLVKSFKMPNLIFMENDFKGMGIGNNNPWAAYQICANTMFSAVLQNMLVNSRHNAISVLPAVTGDFESGSVSGLLTRAGVEVDLQWDKKKGFLSVTLKPKKSMVISLILPEEVKKAPKNIASFNADTHTISDLKLDAQKKVTLEFKF